MKFNNYDICLLTDEKQRMYFLGFHSTAGYVLHSKVRTTFVVDKRYYYAAKKRLECKGFDVVCGSDFTHLANTAESFFAKAIGIDYSVTTLSQLEALKKAVPNVEFVDIGEELRKEASIKYNEELKAIEKSCQIAEKSFKQVLSSLREGVSEKEIAAELEYLFKRNGASDKSFDTIVAFGSNTAVPHHESGNARLRKNMPVLMDFGCVYQGYCSDMTRTMFFGADPGEKFLKVYKAVYDAHMMVFENLREGMTGAEADAIARNHLTKCGYGQKFTHSLGHGIGINIHEFPWLAPKRDNVLANGMVFSNEPGVYFDGQFGIRIEDSLYMKDGKAHTFMRDDKRLMLISPMGKIKKINL